jgi:hypothetical protein
MTTVGCKRRFRRDRLPLPPSPSISGNHTSPPVSRTRAPPPFASSTLARVVARVLRIFIEQGFGPPVERVARETRSRFACGGDAGRSPLASITFLEQIASQSVAIL